MMNVVSCNSSRTSWSDDRDDFVCSNWDKLEHLVEVGARTTRSQNFWLITQSIASLSLFHVTVPKSFWFLREFELGGSHSLLYQLHRCLRNELKTLMICGIPSNRINLVCNSLSFQNPVHEWVEILNCCTLGKKISEMFF
jgi:hypothetical protein